MTRVDFYLLESPNVDNPQGELMNAAGAMGEAESSSSRDSRHNMDLLETICILVEKARRADQSVFLHARSEAQANEIDQALWHHRASSFIPHLNLGSLYRLPATNTTSAANPTTHTNNTIREPAIDRNLGTTTTRSAHAAMVPMPNEPESYVAIGFNHEPAGRRDVLINLCERVPYFFSRFRRTLEIVGGSEQEREASRERYRFYQSRGYPLKHHKLALSR